jgi:hypothetical protein
MILQILNSIFLIYIPPPIIAINLNRFLFKIAAPVECKTQTAVPDIVQRRRFKKNREIRKAGTPAPARLSR